MNPVGHIINYLSNHKDWIIGHTILDVLDNMQQLHGVAVWWNGIPLGGNYEKMHKPLMLYICDHTAYIKGLS